MNNKLSRRRFLQGSAALTGSLVFSACNKTYRPAQPENIVKAYYPPALTGLRGDHDGSQNGPHSVALQGKNYTFPEKATEHYDLVVIGSGISGLTSAYLYRQKHPQAQVLILDNHDDFGGHAKRNEFTYQGRTFVTYGGSESLDSPKTSYSKQAHALLESLGVDYKKFEQYFDQGLYEKKWQLKQGAFFTPDVFGKTAVVNALPKIDQADAETVIRQFPLSEEGKKALVELYTGKIDYLKGKKKHARNEFAEKTSYYDFLKNTVKLPEDALNYLKDISSEYWGHPISAIAVSDALEEGYPGVQHLGLTGEQEPKEPYIYHFPDGNASIARLLVRKLIPGIAPGNTMEDIVLAKFDYSKIDLPKNPVRIRLNSTALLAENNDDGVAVAYLKKGEENLVRVQAKKCIFAGHSALAARIIPQMPEAQQQAEKTCVKIPMIYAKILVKNAQAFKKLGIYSLYAPCSPYCLIQLDDPVNIGSYQAQKQPDEPIIIHAVRIATDFEGQTARDKYRSGRRKLASQNYEVLKEQLFEQFRHLYDAAGEKFDDAVVDFTLNRWAHGYSYEQTTLWDTDQSMKKNTHAMQKPIGNIFMAGCDVAWKPYLQYAVDQAYRAVREASA
ncbi:MAG: NAD(P)-binding protein [Neisseria sp.]|uniref:NAD(P)-binding protein n=1 Tax=Neisseria sp. TaxID=192066 RepID=UPI0026DD585F|nr:NAD(P)-binding protein [Neisseria sp.]MDO4641388.1 NAD(P)-binding protein [Neisseria sp.]